MAALAVHDARALENALDANPESLSARFVNGQTLLHLAAAVGQAESCSLLLRRRADPLAFDDQGRSPLAAAARHGHGACARVLIDAMEAKHLSVVLDIFDDGLWTPLHHAVASGDETTVRLLVDAGAIDAVSPSSAARWTMSPLHIAASKGLADVCALLARAGADVDGQSRPDAGVRTPVIMAAMEGHTEAVRALLAASADASLVDAEGQSAMDWARLLDHDEICAVLQPPPQAAVGAAGKPDAGEDGACRVVPSGPWPEPLVRVCLVPLSSSAAVVRIVGVAETTQ